MTARRPKLRKINGRWSKSWAYKGVNYQPVVRYRGLQWRVTGSYLETLDRGRTYFIPKSRLLDTRSGDPRDLFDWPLHMAESKDPWIMFADFLEAFTRALEIHKPNFNRAKLQRTCVAAYELRRALRSRA